MLWEKSIYTIDEVGAMLQRIGYCFLGTKSISSLIVQGIDNVIGLIKFWVLLLYSEW